MEAFDWIKTNVLSRANRDGTPLRPVIDTVVSVAMDARDKGSAVSRFVQGCADDSGQLFNDTVYKPGADFFVKHPESFAYGLGVAGGLARVKKGPVKMVKGGILGLGLGFGVLAATLL